MMLRRAIYFFALALILLGCKANTEPGKTEGNEKELKKKPAEKENIPEKQLEAYKSQLTNYFDSTLLRRNFNGGILVAKGGHILYEAYIGYIDPSKKTDTITRHTAFHLASTSKPFTGMAVMKLVEAGKIGLDDDIVKYFSGFPYSGVTVSQLLTHRSGLPNYLYFMDDKEKWDQNLMVTNYDVLNFLIKYQPPQSYRPGTRFNYCNTNYVLLALIVEKVTGVPFPQYLKQTIFDPLGMNDTYVYTHADSARSIMSYKPSGALWANDKYEYTYGDKNVYSTPGDMFRWDSALYRDDFISKTILDSAFVPRSNEKPSIHNYGYGWRMLNLKNGKNVIYHNGKWHGFTPAFSRLIEEKAVIIILGNKYSRSIYDAAKHAYNIFGDYMQSESAASEENDQSNEGPNVNAANEEKVNVTPAVKNSVVQQKKTLTKSTQKSEPKNVAKKPATVPPKKAAQLKTSTKAGSKKVTIKTAPATRSKTPVKKKAGQ